MQKINFMKLIKHNNCEDFLAHNEELLIKNESFHNLMLGLAYGIRDKKFETNEPLFYSITDGFEVIACALRSNKDKPLIVTKMPVQAVDLLVQDLTSSGIDLDSIVGEEASATYFKDQWTNLKKLNFKINIYLGVYECKKVIFPSEALGELIQATEDHKETLREYIKGFSLDCFPNSPDTSLDDNVEKLMNRHLQNKSIFLLKSKSDELVSMVANVRSTLNGGTISLVYTPPSLRGKGYASYGVALLSEKIILGGKKFTNLFTDLTNPTSNSIYQKIGFVKIGQNIHFDFIVPS
ncbi:MAG: GNAT family N-acetyltransferase [Bacteriovorax sp.]|nr:GNAT family N-acetyltransferase [Bacteriovorax sp.]